METAPSSTPLPEPPGSLDGGEAGWGPVERLLHECLSAPDDEVEDRLHALCRRHPEHARALTARLRLLQEAGLAAGDTGQEDETFPERLGEFRLLRRLGGGGMGVVYLAEQETLGREVALKLIHPDRLYFPGSRERFLREAAAVARLAHPGIAHLYTYGEEEGIPYFAMAFVRGCTLARVLSRLKGADPEKLRGSDFGRALADADLDAGAAEQLHGGPWVEVCCRLVAGVAEALEHAHAHGVVHRDVKPSNIMVNSTGRALLVDFGLSTSNLATRITRSSSHVGSLPYMAPEQLRGGSADADHRVDVYSLGVTLYELLTLQSPFMAEDSEETRKRILEGGPRSIRSLNQAVAWDVQTVCSTAMEPDRDRRYPSVAAFARDLRNILALRPIDAKPPGPWIRARRWSQRHPLRAAVLVALALGLPALAATGAWLRPQIVAGKEEIRRASVEEALEQGFSTILMQSRDPSQQIAQAVAIFEDVLDLDPSAEEAVGGLLLTLSAPIGEDLLRTWLQRLDSHQRNGCEPRTLDRLRIHLMRSAGRRSEAKELALRLGEPRSASELFLLGVILMRRDRSESEQKRIYRAPLELLTRAVETAPRARFHYHAMRALAAGMAEDKRAAKASADSLETLWPENPRIWHWVCFALKDFDPARAVAAGRRSTSAFPDLENGVEAYGRALVNAGDMAGAVQVHRRNLEAHPDSPWARLSLAVSLAGAREFAEAERHATAALELAPDATALRLGCATVFQKIGQYARMVEQCQEAARLGPKDSEVFAQLTTALHLTGDYEGAKRAALRAIELDPQTAGPHSNLAAALLLLDDVEGAQRAARTAIVLAPDLDAAHRNLCVCLRRLDDLRGVRLELERWACVRPKDPRALEELARLQLDRGSPRTPEDLASALDLALRARELSQGQDPQVLRTLAEAHFALGDGAAAVAAADAALALRPDEKTADFLERRLRKYREAAASRPASSPAGKRDEPQDK